MSFRPLMTVNGVTLTLLTLMLDSVVNKAPTSEGQPTTLIYSIPTHVTIDKKTGVLTGARCKIQDRSCKHVLRFRGTGPIQCNIQSRSHKHENVSIKIKKNNNKNN